jgi:hypothetical protein
MQPTDKQRFAAVMELAAEYFGKTLTVDVMRLYWTALTAYPIEAVESAFQEYICNATQARMPLVSEVLVALGRAEPNSAYPSSDEAWGIAVKTFDEQQTVVVTDEVMGAREAAQPVMDIGDEVGARMAFRDAYNRLVTQARMKGNAKPRWWITNGTDKQLREQAIRQAVDLGRLSRDALKQITGPDPTLTEACRAFDVQAIEHKTKAKEAADISRKLRSLKDTLETRKTNEFHESEMERQRQRDEAEARRREVVRRAEEAMPQNQPDDEELRRAMGSK